MPAVSCCKMSASAAQVLLDYSLRIDRLPDYRATRLYDRATLAFFRKYPMSSLEELFISTSKALILLVK
jgi:hypothetical protein